MIPQFKDVVSKYSPSIIFADGEWDLPSKDWKSEELLGWPGVLSSRMEGENLVITVPRIEPNRLPGQH
jgi:hypothetical protein